jgi:hypothetical protein
MNSLRAGENGIRGMSLDMNQASGLPTDELP